MSVTVMPGSRTKPGGTNPHLSRRPIVTYGSTQRPTSQVSWRTIDSPVGQLVAVHSKSGLLYLGWAATTAEEHVTSLANKLSAEVISDSSWLDQTASELDEYFSGQRREFTMPLDRQLSKGFRLEVLRAMERIPYGQTSSYSGLAAAAGSPNATRAAGTACATNPIAIIVPCHRVLRSDGSLGGYYGGLDAKRLLLELEAKQSN